MHRWACSLNVFRVFLLLSMVVSSVASGFPASAYPAGERSRVPGSGGREEIAAQAQELSRLAATDRKVRAHEQAHQAAGAGLAGGASYQYQRGPDGRQYAVAGEVSIDLTPGRTPDETVVRARQVQAAALAPADPSAQDRAVAAQAARMELEARTQQAGESGTNVQRDPFSVQGIAAYRNAGDATSPLPGSWLDVQA